jgi:prepilin-type N-terminal cleavage/methylation domain-containing protein
MGSDRVSLATIADIAMTLLESLVALVIVALVALGGYELTAASARAASASAEWTAAVARAESIMDASLTSAPIDAGNARVVRAPHAPGLDVIAVQVPVAQGASYTLRRLVPASAPFALVP